MKNLIMKWLNNEAYLIKIQNQLLKETLQYLCYAMDAQDPNGQRWSGDVSKALDKAKNLLVIVK